MADLKTLDLWESLHFLHALFGCSVVDRVFNTGFREGAMDLVRLLLSSEVLRVVGDLDIKAANIYFGRVLFLRPEVLLIARGVDSWHLDFVHPELRMSLGLYRLVKVGGHGLELLAPRAASVGVVLISNINIHLFFSLPFNTWFAKLLLSTLT